MCAGYWSIKEAELKCPKCERISVFENLQTHYGEYGYMEVFEFGKKATPIAEIKEADILPDEGFTGYCRNCRDYVDFGAKIKDGKVIKLFSTNIK